MTDVAIARPSSDVSTCTNAAHKYRGAVVEDLQLPPAFALPQTERISRAIELAFDRDFSHIPILSRDRKPVGYLDVVALKQKYEAGEASPDDSVLQHMVKFQRDPSHTYTLITPDTPLHELEEFLGKNEFAIVTDGERKFVLGVTTISDLNVSIRIDRTETYPGDLIIVEDIRKEARYLEAVHNNVCGRVRSFHLDKGSMHARLP